MMNMVKLGDVISITSGQILSRIVSSESIDEPYVEKRKVVVPKAILSDGTIDVLELPEEKLKAEADKKRLTEIGDIVIKLSTPYDSAIISTAEMVGCIIPSFCAIIKNNETIDKNYLQAYLSSSICKEKLKMQVAGATMGILSIGKIKEIDIPLPSMEKQIEIGNLYLQTQQKIMAMKKIVYLENKKLDLMFKNLG